MTDEKSVNTLVEIPENKSEKTDVAENLPLDDLEKRETPSEILNDFLSKIPEVFAEAGEELPDNVEPASKDDLIQALRQVYDPEIMINIYDLGLVYKADISPSGDVDIDMTLTSPLCPMADEMPWMVVRQLQNKPGFGKIKVRLVWNPPWTLDKLSEEARLMLNLD